MFTRIWSEKAGTWKLGVFLACAVFVLGMGTTPAFAVGGVDELGLFELDGNAVDDPVGGADDWQNVAEGTDSAVVVTHDGQEGIVFDTFDPINTDDVLTGGGTKDENDIPDWAWKLAKPTPDKDNITNAYAAAYTSDGELIIYFGADRYANNGDAMIGFWFFKSEITENGSTHGFDGSHVEGDVLVVTNFTRGGVVDTVLVYEWVDSGGDASEHLLLMATGEACNATGQDVCARNNVGGEMAYWPYAPKFGDPGYFPENSFFEGGINMSHIFNGAAPCFTSFMAETRTSQSTDAVLKDFVLASFPLCGIEASKTCDILRLATNDDEGNSVPPKAFLVEATVTLTNTGIGALPFNTTVCIDDNPTGDSTDPPEFCEPLGTVLTNGQSKDYTVQFYSNDNPPSNTATVTVTFDSQTLEAETDLVPCGGLDLTPDIYLEKDCTTSLTVESNLVAAKVNYGIRVCNTGDVPLSITLSDPTANVSELVVLDFTDQLCTANADCDPDGECLEGRCVNKPGYVTDGPICASYPGYYLPSVAYPVPPGAELTPCNATFTNTVTAVGTSPLIPPAGVTEMATATCYLCDNCP